jgi:hypothetical protein
MTHLSQIINDSQTSIILPGYGFIFLARTVHCKWDRVAVFYYHLHLVRLGQSRRRNFCILQALFRQGVEYLTLLTNKSEIMTYKQTCMLGSHKTTLRLDMLTLFHYNLSPQQRGSKSACLCTSFQNLRTSQLHACSRNHTWHLRSCNCVDWEGKGKVHHINGQQVPEEEEM